MTNVAEFIEIRQRIELLTQQIVVSTERKAVPESSHRLDEAVQLLGTLTAMADNDVQDIAVGRLTRQLNNLGIKVGALTAKKRVVKKQLIVEKPA
jgi:hypothetical protein